MAGGGIPNNSGLGIQRARPNCHTQRFQAPTVGIGGLHKRAFTCPNVTVSLSLAFIKKKLVANQLHVDIQIDAKQHIESIL